MKKLKPINNTFSLLLGNGINRAFGGLEWEELLKAIETEYAIDEIKYVSSPMKFEYIMDAIVSKTVENEKTISPNRVKELYGTIKEKIGKECQRKSLSGQGKRRLKNALADCGVSHIITTNYDYNIEKLITGSSRTKTAESVIWEDKYVFKPTGTYKDSKTRREVRFYHPHGLIDYPNTICLGFNHYADILGKVVNMYGIDSNNGFSDRITTIMSQRGWRNDIDETFGYLFFFQNMYVVGLGLDFQEIDLWWLLSFRAYLKAMYPDVIKNVIVYYQLVNDDKYRIKAKDTKEEKEEKNKKRNELIAAADEIKKQLEGMGVSVQQVHVKDKQNGWKDSYLEALQDIKDRENRKSKA